MKLPENTRSVVSAVVKHHFWLLALFVPLLVVPMLVLANSDISKKIDRAQSDIKSKISAVESVLSTSPHPNEEWASEINKQTLEIRRETWQSWKQAYLQQQQIRAWPESLGQDFKRYVDRLGPDDELPMKQRELYQNSVASIVKLLPARMGADDFMEATTGMAGMDGASEGFGGMGTAIGSRMMGRGLPSGGMRRLGRGAGMDEEGRPLVGMMQRPKVDWAANDQSRIYQSFVWENTPSTTQILLAQEEIWIYGVLCDAIAFANRRSTGHYNAAIPTVQEVVIGYQAAEDQPGGEGTGRIISSVASNASMMSGIGGTDGMGMMSTDDDDSGFGDQVSNGSVRPPHPRFGGGRGFGGMGMGGMGMGGMGMGMGGMGMGGMGMGMGGIGMGGMGMGEDGFGDGGSGDGVGSEEDALYNWIYVDFDGKPLTKTDIDASPTSRMLRLMPFRLRIQISEQKLDGFLLELATQTPVLIDVRQVRINPSVGGGFGTNGIGSGMGGGGLGRSGRLGGGNLMGGGMPPEMDGMGDGDIGYGAGVKQLGGRNNDLDVEIRGAIVIVAKPVPEVIGLSQDELPTLPDQKSSDEASVPANRNRQDIAGGGVS